MILNFFSSAILFTSIASATKLVPETPSVGNTPSVATTPALHHDDNQFLSQADTWSQDKCFRTRNMIKKTNIPELYSFYRDINQKEDRPHDINDNDFYRGSTARFWADQGEESRNEDIRWKRARTDFSEATLFGEKGVTVDDVAQGSIGNCWLMAAFASLAENPKRVEKAFLNTKNEQAPTGLYGVNLFVLGHPMTIFVDDWLPVNTHVTYSSNTAGIEERNEEATTVFSKIASDGSLWVSILEKVFAKRYGNYQHLSGGDTRDGLSALTGGPSIALKHSTADAETLWNMLLQHDSQSDYIQAGTAGNNDQRQNSVGLSMGHAYTVLGARVLSQGAKKGTKLVKVRNPWGHETYNGPWSDKSDMWDAQSIKEVNMVDNTADGIFWTDFDTYKTNFSSTSINYDPENWAQAKFLMIDDNSSTKGTIEFCGPTCTKHSFKLTSTVKQKVFITAHTWQDRGISEECRRPKDEGEDGPEHFVMINDGPCHVFKSGDRKVPPIDMEAGQTIDIVLEWNFADGMVPKDWGLTTQGNSGVLDSLSLVHFQGLRTNNWRYMNRDETKGNAAYWSKND